MPNAIERRKKMQEQITRLSLGTNIKWSFEFFDAIVGKNLAEELQFFCQLWRITTDRLKRNLGPGELGCLLSHMSIWAKLASQVLPYDSVIVLEDDAILVQPNLSEHIISLINNSTDFALLGGLSDKSRQRVKGEISQNSLYFRLYGPSYHLTYAYSYFITPIGAQELLKNIIQHFTVADDWDILLPQSYYPIPFVYAFEHGGIEDSTLSSDRTTFIQKKDFKSRIKKNAYKAYKDIVTQLYFLLRFKKSMRLSQYIEQEKSKYIQS